MESVDQILKRQNPNLYEALAPLIQYVSDPFEETKSKFNQDEDSRDSTWITVFEELDLMEANEVSLLEAILNEEDVAAIAQKTHVDYIVDFLDQKLYPTILELLSLNETYHITLCGLRLSAAAVLPLPQEIKNDRELDFILSLQTAARVYTKFPNLARTWNLKRCVKEGRIGLFRYLLQRLDRRPEIDEVLCLAISNDDYFCFTDTLIQHGVVLTIYHLASSYKSEAKETVRFLLGRVEGRTLPQAHDFFKRVVLKKDAEILGVALAWSKFQSTADFLAVYNFLLDSVAPDFRLVEMFEAIIPQEWLVERGIHEAVVIYCLEKRKLKSLCWLLKKNLLLPRFFDLCGSTISELTQQKDDQILKQCLAELMKVKRKMPGNEKLTI